MGATAAIVAAGLGGLLSGMGSGKSGGGKAASKHAKRAGHRASVASNPKQFMKLVEKYEPFFRRLYEPGRVQATDTAALGEQVGLQGLDADAARRGLLGSGYHLSGRTAIGTARQGQAQDALTEYYVRALAGAIQQAGETQRLKVSALTGAPIPSGANPIAGGLLSGAGRSLSLYGAYGGQNRPAPPGYDPFMPEQAGGSWMQPGKPYDPFMPESRR